MDNSTLVVIAVMGGLISATLSLLQLFPLPGLLFISFFASLPLFLIGLGVGLRPLYGAGLVATFFILLVEGPLFAANFFIFSALTPIFLMNRSLLNRKRPSGKVVWYPSSFLLRDLTLISGILMLLALGVYLYLMQDKDVHTLIKSFLTTFDPQGHVKEAESLLLSLFPFLPGFFAFSWAIMVLINAMVAQGLLSRFQRNLRPSPSLENIEAPKSFVILFGLTILLSWVGVGSLALLGKNAALVLILPFFLVGLGLVHRWIGKTSFPTTGLTLFYFLLFLLFWPIFFIILLGILKPWIEKAIPSN